MWVHTNPGPIEKFLSNGDVPLLSVTSSAIPVTCDARLPTKNYIDTNYNQQVCHWNGVRIKLGFGGANLLDGPCSGELCGGRELFVDTVMKKKCACMQITQGDKGIFGLYQFRIWRKVGNEEKSFYVPTFTAKAWTHQFLVEGNFPIGMTAARLNSNPDTQLDFMRAVGKRLEFFNQRGGFDFTGWVKRGDDKYIRHHRFVCDLFIHPDCMFNKSVFVVFIFFYC